MTFPWYEPNRPKISPEASAHKRDEAIKQDLEDRASLLFRLGYSKDRAKARLRANVRWECELNGKPRSVESEREIDKLVDAVWRRGGGSGPPTV